MAPSTDDADPGDRLATGLGLFSVGLGTAQLLAPGRVNRLIGIRDDRRARRWQRVVGMQELSAAAGIFGPGAARPWLVGRTVGDVMHLGMLARAAGTRGEHPARLAGAIASVVGCLGADATASVRTSRRSQNGGHGEMEGKATITIGEEREAVMRRWRAFEEGPAEHARLGPVEVVDETADRSYGFRTTDDADVRASGVVVFADAPQGRGTEIHLDLDYVVPAGPVGAAVQKVAGTDPLQAARDDLRRLKQLVETGEVVKSEGAPTGPSARLQPKQRPAQPVEA
jgi:uncharacterized membrane protein